MDFCPFFVCLFVCVFFSLLFFFVFFTLFGLMSFFLKIPGHIIRQKFYSDKYRTRVLEQTSEYQSGSYGLCQTQVCCYNLGALWQFCSSSPGLSYRHLLRAAKWYIGTYPLTSSRHGGGPQLCPGAQGEKKPITYLNMDVADASKPPMPLHWLSSNTRV